MIATTTPTTVSSRILVNDIVTILGDNRFTGQQGLVVDTESDLRPEDGPIAVFFDLEVPDHEFNLFHREKTWKKGPPSKKDYKECYRVRCFQLEELRAEPDFSFDSLLKRNFGNDYHTAYSLKFRLKPGTHACQFASCKTGLLATKITLVNVWGAIHMIYGCEPCHAEWHRTWVEELKYKEPLPGAD